MNGMIPWLTFKLTATQQVKDAILALSFIDELDDVPLLDLYKTVCQELGSQNPKYAELTRLLEDALMQTLGRFEIGRYKYTVIGVTNLSPVICIWSTANERFSVAGLPAHFEQCPRPNWWQSSTV